MKPGPPPAAPFAANSSFPVSFQGFPSREYNADLKGRGTFEAQEAPAAYRFTGKKRGFLPGKSTAMDFSPADIRNVAVEGRKVRFSTGSGRSGDPGRPFVFFCRNAGNAAEIAGLLPKSVDVDFAATRDFGERLRRLPAARSPLGSVTGIIIGLNVAVFLVMAGLLNAGWIEAADLTPYILYGANNAAATTDGEWWRLITSMFMHYGVLHLALNMWALFQAGQLLERLQGRALYTATYMASGIGGGFLSMAWNGDRIWSAGASGAIFGVYGALLGYMLREKQALPKQVFQPMMKSTLVFAGYNLLYGLVHPGIDNGAHVGGLMTGIGLGWLTAPPLDPAARASLLGGRLQLAGLAFAVMVAVGVATAPRFDYKMREEIAWSGAVKGFVSSEPGLVSQLNADISAWRRAGASGNGGELGRLIKGKLIPLYSDLAQRIDALALEPGRLTGRRRGALSEYAHLRIESLQHLMSAAGNNDMAEYKAFTDLNAKALAAIEPLRTPPNARH